jgi:hypothetical protein
MSYSSTEYLSFQKNITEEELKRILDDLHFVVSIFDETKGPSILFNESPLESDILENLNLKVFHFLMQSTEFGPSNFATMRGIVQIPYSVYYTSAIDLIVKKRDLKRRVDVFVPLVIFLIFPKKDLFFYARIAKNLEDYLSKIFEKGFRGIPTLTALASILNKLRKRIYSIEFI